MCVIHFVEWLLEKSRLKYIWDSQEERLKIVQLRMIIAMKEWKPAIYIMTNKRNGTLYTGVTNNLLTRLYQHKQGVQPGFTKQYGCTQLVYYELYADMLSAIAREKQIKAGSRKKKLALIEGINPRWLDLYETLI